MDEKIKLGISSCLLGEKVRYNGQHKFDYYLVDVLGKSVEYIPVCPEVEVGLPVPRDPMQLRWVGDENSPRLIVKRKGIDCTDQMHAWIKTCLDRLEMHDLCGFVFKSKSPSCGMEDVTIYRKKGPASKNGVGLFASAFMERFPLIPVEDEELLHDIEVRESFLVRVLTYYRWHKTIEGARNVETVSAFHEKNKLFFMAYNPRITRQLATLIDEAEEMKPDEFLLAYETLMMSCMSYKTTVKKNLAVLLIMGGYLKKHLKQAEKIELEEMIENYRKERYPLVVPLTLIKHFVRKYRAPYLKDQYYLDPLSVELKLRNHA